jgi:hypothetical protein
MPYIKQEERNNLDHQIDAIIENLKLDSDVEQEVPVGKLNYVITRILAESIPEERYKHINSIIGVLECAKLEFYRRLAAPYEDGAISKDGDLEVYLDDSIG